MLTDEDTTQQVQSGGAAPGLPRHQFTLVKTMRLLNFTAATAAAAGMIVLAALTNDNRGSH